MKELIASGTATARGPVFMDFTLNKNGKLTSCPQCGQIQVGAATTMRFPITVTYYYDCGRCYALWDEDWRFVPSNASIVGGDSDGNIYTSSVEVLS